MANQSYKQDMSAIPSTFLPNISISQGIYQNVHCLREDRHFQLTKLVSVYKILLSKILYIRNATLLICYLDNPEFYEPDVCCRYRKNSNRS